MKKFLVIVLLLFGTSVFAQETVHELENFEGIKVYNGLEINLIKADSNRAVVSGQNRSEVDFSIKNGVLNIKKSIDNIWKKEDVNIKVYYTGLQMVNAIQNATVRINGTMKQGNLDLETQEGAEIYANIEVNQLAAKALTGGLIDVEGTIGHQEVTVRAGGKFYGGNLRSRNTSVNISMGGVADVNASKEVIAKVKAGGTVNVYGNPEVIDQQTLFGGKVISKN